MKPQVKLTIDLTGPDGNVYAVIGRVCDTLRRAGRADKAIEFKTKAFKMHGYEAVLELAEEYVDVTYKR